MDFDEVVVKESPGLCRCCLSEGCYKDLGSEYSWMGDTEIYADMLLECFDIGISQHIEGPNGPNRLICEVCITRLRDACNFKKQVVESEKKFVDMVGRGEFRDKAVVFEGMKTEPPPQAEALDVEYLDDIDFGEEADPEDLLKTDTDAEGTEDITVAALPVKRGRGRPRKHPAVKPEKKSKLAKYEEKARSSKSSAKDAKEEKSAKPTKTMSSTKRNRLMKENAIMILESANLVPFKWQRQNYLCFFCHKTFKEIDSLKEHTTQNHQKSSVKNAVLYLRRDEMVKIDISTATCKICDCKIEDLNSLISHLKNQHEKVFAEEFGYGVIPYKFNGDTYKCAICDKELQYFTKLNQHMNSHFGSYICDVCGKSLLSRDRLRCHTLTHTSGFKCKECGMSFTSLVRRKQHEITEHKKDKSLKCIYCTESFKNYSQRLTHHKIAHGLQVPDYKCNVCSKVFQLKSKMQVHVKEVHDREKNFPCSMCDMKFFSKSHVQKHMVKHSGERTHRCEVCNKSFLRKQTLTFHMRIHNNDKRYSCQLCDQSFVQNNSLKVHMGVHHPCQKT